MQKIRDKTPKIDSNTAYSQGLVKVMVEQTCREMAMDDLGVVDHKLEIQEADVDEVGELMAT